MNLEKEINWLLDEKYSGLKSEAFYLDVKKLETGTPLAFVIGSIPFLNTTITLDSHPLIPRTETEFWVEKVITEIRKFKGFKDHKVSVLDLCAGSGCIGIAIAKALPRTQVDFIEIDQAHLPTISKNCQQNQIADNRVRIMRSNLFETGNELTLLKYDFIVSNPPYIDPKVDRTEEAVKVHEPKIALYGGNLGLELIKKIIENSPYHLTKRGQVWIEHEPEQSTTIAKLANENGFDCHTEYDQYGLERFSKLVLQ